MGRRGRGRWCITLNLEDIPESDALCYYRGMKGKPRKSLPRDPAQRAKAIFDRAIGEIDSEEKHPRKEYPSRARGGKARALALSSEQRAEIAKLAANARWKKSKAKEPPK